MSELLASQYESGSGGSKGHEKCKRNGSGIWEEIPVCLLDIIQPNLRVFTCLFRPPSETEFTRTKEEVDDILVYWANRSKYLPPILFTLNGTRYRTMSLYWRSLAFPYDNALNSKCGETVWKVSFDKCGLLSFCPDHWFRSGFNPPTSLLVTGASEECQVS